jgi:hypothetical protein
MPMQKIFTPVILAYQSFGNISHVDNILIINNVSEPSEIFSKLFDELEEKAPEISNEIIESILSKVNRA